MGGIQVSIHAPARGATYNIPLLCCQRLSFNPRPCARGDLMVSIGRNCVFQVSIHAPARGATAGASRQCAQARVSIHAPARGATLTRLGDVSCRTGFNPRPCARGDYICALSSLPLTRFNPRPCARGDPPSPVFVPGFFCFNPRPCARGDSGLISELR